MKKPRWHRRPKDRPEEILEAAFTAFRRHGYAATGMEEVARLAGISAGTIYRYFDSKEELFRALVRRLADRVMGELRTNLSGGEDQGGDWPTRLRRVASRMYEHLSRPHTMGLLQLALGEGQQMPELPRIFYHEVVLRAEEIFTGLIGRAMDEGQLRRIDPVVAHRAFAGMLIVCAMERRIFRSRRPHLNPKTLTDQLIRIYLGGLGTETKR